jgi:AraC family transcriptional regulator
MQDTASMNMSTVKTSVPPALRWSDHDEARWQKTAGCRVEQPWQGLPEHVQKTSAGSPWKGLMVWHQTGPVEDLFIPPAGMHCILLRKGTPTELLQRQGNTIHHLHWQPGEVIVVPADTPTFWRSSAPRDNIHIDLAPVWLRSVAGEDVLLAPCLGRKDPVLAGFAQVLLASLDSPISLHPLFGEHIAQAIAMHLVEHYSNKSVLSKGEALSMREVKTLTHAVSTELHKRWTTSRLAGLIGLSPFHFSRAFKATVGITPHAWVTLQRMEAAARLVYGTKASMAEIANLTGYPSSAHFSQVFQRHWGVPPSAYRRQGHDRG